MTNRSEVPVDNRANIPARGRSPTGDDPGRTAESSDDGRVPALMEGPLDGSEVRREA
jgi:hypothetical protein